MDNFMSRSEGQSSPSLNINTFSSCSCEWNTRVNSVPKIWYLWIYNFKKKLKKKKNNGYLDEKVMILSPKIDKPYLKNQITEKRTLFHNSF